MQKNTLCWQMHQKWRIMYWKPVRVYSGLWVIFTINLRVERKQTCKWFLFCARTLMRAKFLPSRTLPDRCQTVSSVECGTSGRRRSGTPSRRTSGTVIGILVAGSNLYLLTLWCLDLLAIKNDLINKFIFKDNAVGYLDKCWILGLFLNYST